MFLRPCNKEANHTTDFIFNNAMLDFVTETNILGVFFTQDLSRYNRVGCVQTKRNEINGLLEGRRHILPKPTKITLYNALLLL